MYVDVLGQAGGLLLGYIHVRHIDDHIEHLLRVLDTSAIVRACIFTFCRAASISATWPLQAAWYHWRVRVAVPMTRRCAYPAIQWNDLLLCTALQFTGLDETIFHNADTDKYPLVN